MSDPTDAIQEDVSVNATTDEQIPAPKSSRELAMEALEAKRLGEFERESGVQIETDNDGSDSLNVSDQLNTQTSEPAAKVLDAVEGVRVKIKVDGEEREVELSDVLRDYQKGSAADKRLEEATRLLKDAQARAAALPDPAPDSQVDAQRGDDEITGKAKEALSLLYAGDEDAAAKALASLITTGGAQPTRNVDVDQVATAVQQRLEVDSAFAKIKTDYPEIVANKDLDTLTTMKAQAKEAAGIPRARAMLEAAGEVYELIGKKSGRQSNDSQRTTRDEKLARKAALDEPRAANASVASSSSDDGQDDSPSAVIAAMAARRLGQSMPRVR